MTGTPLVHRDILYGNLKFLLERFKKKFLLEDLYMSGRFYTTNSLRRVLSNREEFHLLQFADCVAKIRRTFNIYIFNAIMLMHFGVNWVIFL